VETVITSWHDPFSVGRLDIELVDLHGRD